MAEGTSNDIRKISDIFDEGLDIFNHISKSNEPTNSVSVQSQIKKAMRLLEDVTRLVSVAGIFSSNESVDEVSTENTKYFLLPALLGTLSLKLCIENRIEVVQTAEVYFIDFLKRCNTHGIVDIEVPEPVPEEPPDQATQLDKENEPQSLPVDLIAMARERNEKLQRYKQQKELESELEELREKMENLNVDDEIKRKYFITLVKSFASQAVDELHSLKMERPLLEHMAKVRQGLSLPESEQKCKLGKYPPRKPLRPIIITKDEVQKKVFGAGYPSLPTMTVAEFYEQRVKDGVFPGPGAPNPTSLQELASRGNQNTAEEMDAIEKEKQVEADDDKTLRQAREWDEFKDEHRRGFGNRMNRS